MIIFFRWPQTPGTKAAVVAIWKGNPDRMRMTPYAMRSWVTDARAETLTEESKA
jgi:hypothetical protein